MADQDKPSLPFATAHEGGPSRFPLSKNQPSTTAPIHPQGTSKFFRRFPQEIRDMVYFQVFAFTRLAHGLRWETRHGPLIRMKPAPNSLALLRTCRRTKQEIGDRWLRHVLFDFHDPYAMIEKLSQLPKQMISQIRHIRVNLKSICIAANDDRLHFYDVVVPIKVLPGLKLDTLTVLAELEPNHNYEMLSRLIRNPDGWNELRFLTPTSEMLGHNDHEEETLLLLPQPGHWKCVLECQDGTESHPSVVVYRAKKPFGARKAKGGVMMAPSQWETYEQTDKVEVRNMDGEADAEDTETEFDEEDADTEADDGQHYGERIDRNIMLTAEGRGKEVVVIARRGKGADYEENDNWKSPEDRAEFHEYVTEWIEERKHWIYWRWLLTEHGIPVALGTPPGNGKILNVVDQH